jgi:hypothetical protein
MAAARMVLLRTVPSGFHARVLAARLGSDGIVAQLRGAVDGPYPIGDVMVYVGEDDLDTAQELLLADEVEAAFDDADDDDAGGAFRRSHLMTWMALAMLVSLWCAVMVRGI